MFYCSNISHVVTAFVNNIDILPVDSDPLGGYWPQVAHVSCSYIDVPVFRYEDNV